MLLETNVPYISCNASKGTNVFKWKSDQKNTLVRHCIPHKIPYYQIPISWPFRHEIGRNHFFWDKVISLKIGDWETVQKFISLNV